MKLRYPNFKNLLTVLLLCFTALSFAQSTKNVDYREKVNQPNANFYDIVFQKRAEFAAMDLSIRANNKAMKQFERWAYIWKDKVNADGSFPSASNQLISKRDYIERLMTTQFENRSFLANPWTQIGPVDRPLENGYAGYPGKGRVNVIAEDPNDPTIMYAGSAAGGIWKTTNDGALWSPKSDFLAGLGVTDILVDPANTSIIYMATGDEDAEHISSIGVFKSTDAGDTWNPTGLTFSLDENEYIRDLAFAPGSSTKIFALTNQEIKVTTNSGVSWSDIPVTYPFDPFDENFQNIVFDPNDVLKVVVSDQFDALYVSTDGGASFVMHAVFQGGDAQKKLKITSSTDDPDFFYGISEEIRENDVITEEAEFRKYRYNFTDTAADLISTTALTGFNSQQGYNQNIAVSPINKNNIIVAGVNGFRSTNGGTSFSTLMNAYNEPPGVGFYVHADHHHVSFVENTEIVLNGHDGGIHKGPFNATTASPWADISNTLVITQPYNIAVTQESDGDNFMMANQDNDGFSKILQGGNRNWLSAIAGDGTSTGIDIVNSNIRYLGGTNGQLYRADAGYADGYDQATYILGTNNDAAFVSPMSVHPSNANIIYACHGDIKKSTNKGGTGEDEDWTALGSGLTNTKFIDVTANGGSIRIYTINEEGNARRSDNDGATWTTVTPPVGQVINSFSAIPNSTIVYATVSGYNAGNKVYKSTNSGATWTNISAGLPNIIMKKVVANRASTNETLYLGTELGPYFRTNVADWLKLGTGLPNVRVEDLEINYTDNRLYIGTFGRGMWGISIANDCTGVAKTWDGSWNPAGAPTINDPVIIAATYNASTNGNLEACNLTINSGVTVTVPGSSYVRVNRNIVIDGTLVIEHTGSLVQVDNAATVTNNGIIQVNVTTPVLEPREFMLMGSPMSNETREGVFGAAYDVRHHLTANFVPNADVATQMPGAENFADDNLNNFLNHTGTVNPGEGYLVRSQPDNTSSGSYNLTFDQGTINNGEINFNVLYNTPGPTAADNKNASPNIIANPYPSAIFADDLINANAMVDEVYFWEHVTPPSTTIPGANTMNFSMEDISMYNLTGGTAATSDPSTTPTGYIATGQGFAIKATASGTLAFNNNMRRIDNNNTLRRPINMDRIWLTISANEYNLERSTLVGFSENATAQIDNGYDSRRLATVLSLFTHLPDGSQELGIQAREDFNVDMQIPMGFSSLIDASTQYKISIAGLEGVNLNEVNVYLVDYQEGVITNLSEADYFFSSGKGTYENRFVVQFRDETILDINENALQNISVYPNPTATVLTISSPHSLVNKIEIYDIQGRIVSFKEFNSEKYCQMDLSRLETAMYFVNIVTEKGSITKKVLKE